jgi:hypothetical protein
MKKFDRCTSLSVTLHEMSYKNRCMRIAWLTGITRPPKKRKLCLCWWVSSFHPHAVEHTQKREKTCKNGIHLMFSQSLCTRSFSPRRYSSSVYTTFPNPKNTTIVTSHISKLCM